MYSFCEFLYISEMIYIISIHIEFKRWTRRLKEYGFTKEDAEVLALATFGTTLNGDILGMHILATSDQPMESMFPGYSEAIVADAAKSLNSILSCIFTHC